MTRASTTTYAQLLDRLIADGIAEVRVAYADPEDHHKRDGAIEGFEACRGKAPSELVELWRAAESEAHRMRAERASAQSDAKNYWRQRYKGLQIEFVLNVISVGLKQPLLAHLPTARGAMKYAEIVGVSGAPMVLS